MQMEVSTPKHWSLVVSTATLNFEPSAFNPQLELGFPGMGLELMVEGQ